MTEVNNNFVRINKSINDIDIPRYNGNEIQSIPIVITPPLFDNDILLYDSIDNIWKNASGNNGQANEVVVVGEGTSIFKQKSGVDLEFKSLIADTNISIVSNTDDITFTNNIVDSSSVDHNTTMNYVADEHIDWTSTSENLNTSGSVTLAGGIVFTPGNPVVVSGTSLDFQGVIRYNFLPINNYVVKTNSLGTLTYDDANNIVTIPTSTFQSIGVNENTTLTQGTQLIIVDTSVSTITITLPSAEENLNQVITILNKNGSNNVTVTGPAGAKIYYNTSNPPGDITLLPDKAGIFRAIGGANNHWQTSNIYDLV